MLFLATLFATTPLTAGNDALSQAEARQATLEARSVALTSLAQSLKSVVTLLNSDNPDLIARINALPTATHSTATSRHLNASDVFAAASSFTGQLSQCFQGGGQAPVLAIFSIVTGCAANLLAKDEADERRKAYEAFLASRGELPQRNFTASQELAIPRPHAIVRLASTNDFDLLSCYSFFDHSAILKAQDLLARPQTAQEIAQALKALSESLFAVSETHKDFTPKPVLPKPASEETSNVEVLFETTNELLRALVRTALETPFSDSE